LMSRIDVVMVRASVGITRPVSGVITDLSWRKSGESGNDRGE